MSKDANNSSDLLNEAIRAASSGSAKARKPEPARAPASAPSADLRSVLNELAGGDGTVRRAAAKTGSAPDARLGDAVQDAYATGQPVDVASGAASASTLRRVGLAALAVALLAGGVALWWAPMRLSGPADTLHELAQAVEQYRASHNGELPKELATLQPFPKNAVEWPLRYWKARDAAGRTEIFWVPQRTSHYRIVLRQGSEVWTVSDREGKPKLTMRGIP